MAVKLPLAADELADSMGRRDVASPIQVDDMGALMLRERRPSAAAA